MMININNKIPSFPYILLTKSGYRAHVTNPEKGHYHFKVVEPKNYPPFDWLVPNYYQEKPQFINQIFDNVQNDLLCEFFGLNEQ